MADNGYTFRAALFDLDGVVFDTESQYTVFWRQEGLRYHPEIPGLEYQLKGQTLVQIYDRYFSDVADEQPEITGRLNDFERNMCFRYVNGFKEFVSDLRRHGVYTAVVTSSNMDKMSAVYRQHTGFKSIFDVILTSEDFAASKPSPDCYLRAMAGLGVQPSDSVVFEDSFNGLESARASGAFVVGLSTTNKAEDIATLSDIVVSDFRGITYGYMIQMMGQSKD